MLWGMSVFCFQCGITQSFSPSVHSTSRQQLAKHLPFCESVVWVVSETLLIFVVNDQMFLDFDHEIQHNNL